MPAKFYNQIAAESLGDGTPDATKTLRGDGSWVPTLLLQNGTSVRVTVGDTGHENPSEDDVWIDTTGL